MRFSRRGVCVMYMRVLNWTHSDFTGNKALVTPRDFDVLTRQNASHLEAIDLLVTTASKGTAYSTQSTHMSTNNPKSDDASPHFDKASLIKGLNPAQRQGNFRSPTLCVLASYSA